MHYNDVIGSLGVGLILLAYFLNTFSFIKKDGQLFFVMNIVGAAVACYASFLIRYIPFVILEGTWTLVSIIGLARLYSKKQS